MWSFDEVKGARALHPSPFTVHGAAQRRSTLHAVMAAAVVAAINAPLAGCGFHLRRSAALPFRTLYTNFSPTSAIGAEFRRLVRVAQDTRLVDDPKEADARLEVLSETREKEVVGYSSTGRPREYQLRLRFTFRVVARDSTVRLPPTEIILHRDITSSDIEQVAKQQEEELLYKEMQSDLVQQLLRRLAAIG
ncbi:MAG: LPS assembly lipoprotein LptE [Burkholderiaceae bacterium]|jgi:LPS-assembly lipoprotein|nr:LPS assembly lipoprotein LptE [Burkholderiaceae bacterium]